MPDGTYWVAKMGDKAVGGLFPLTGPQFDGVPEGWMSYLAVDDVDARVKKAQATGAKLMRPIFDVPGVGRIAILTEPGGAGSDPSSMTTFFHLPPPGRSTSSFKAPSA